MPEAFQIVEFPLFMIENMNYYVTKVKKNPHAFLKSFGMGGIDPFRMHLAFYDLGQTLDMPG